jgi:polysaccharide deacetylase family protein (PEP-CTERM system associated)
MSERPSILNAMTVDVEDYFQVSAFDPYVSRDSWEQYPGRVEENMDRILEMFSRNAIKATFFTLGWIAMKYPALVKKIVDDGHDLASHGWDHRMVTQLNRSEFEQDVAKSKQMLEQVSGSRVIGYRAPSYSFTKANDWAHAVLAEQGYRYSSSVAPIKHAFYGIPDAPRFAHDCENGAILEIPITTTRMLGRNLPCGGGGWFRLYPYFVSTWALDRVTKSEGRSAIFYFHPWEIDPEQPRIDGIGSVARFRHFQNMKHMEPRLNRLMKQYRWGTIPDVFGAELGTTSGAE